MRGAFALRGFAANPSGDAAHDPTQVFGARKLRPVEPPVKPGTTRLYADAGDDYKLGVLTGVTMARDTIPDRLLRHAEARPEAPALWSRRGDRWIATNWSDYAQACLDFAGGLLEAGYAPGDAVAILGGNSPEWIIADVGAMFARGVAAGIYQTSTAEQAAYVAAHCEARIIVVEDAAQAAKLLSVQDRMPALRTLVLLRDAERVDDPRVVTFEAFLARGRAHRADVQACFAELRDADLATLIYTSGTTGPPKGVMLSHANLAYVAREACKLTGSEPIGPDDCVVSYLPLSHIAEQMFSIHLPLTAGVTVWCCEAIEKLREVLADARPTVFLAVPRVWEKFKVALEGRLSEQRGVKRAIVTWSRGVGLEAGRWIVERGPPGGVLGLKHGIARRLFFTKLLGGLGLDRLRLAVTGAAPIGVDVLEFFLSCGIVIHEVYGQSEGSGPTTFNRIEPGKRRLGTVGLPFPGVAVRVAEDGEILVRGPNVFMGYHKDPQATAEAIDAEGWLHSGDVGSFDAEGFLRITDRKKDLIITAGGKNVAPQNIEKLLRAIEGVSQAVVIGDNRKYLTALITVDPARAPSDATQRRAHVQAGVDRVNAQLARYEQVKRFEVLPNDFTVEGGELTPTQKIMRKAVAGKYAKEIAALYAEHDDLHFTTGDSESSSPSQS